MWCVQSVVSVLEVIGVCKTCGESVCKMCGECFCKMVRVHDVG